MRQFGVFFFLLCNSDDLQVCKSGFYSFVRGNLLFQLWIRDQQEHNIKISILLWCETNQNINSSTEDHANPTNRPISCKGPVRLSQLIWILPCSTCYNGGRIRKQMTRIQKSNSYMLILSKYIRFKSAGRAGLKLSLVFLLIPVLILASLDIMFVISGKIWI